MMPDAELLAEAWAKQTTAITDIVKGGIATSLPEEKRMPVVFLRVFQLDVTGSVAEGSDNGVAFLQWDAYAFRGHNANPDWTKASLLARTLVEQMAALREAIIPDLGTIQDFARITGPKKEVEQKPWARFRVDTIMAMHA